MLVRLLPGAAGLLAPGAFSQAAIWQEVAGSLGSFRKFLKKGRNGGRIVEKCRMMSNCGRVDYAPFLTARHSLRSRPGLRGIVACLGGKPSLPRWDVREGKGEISQGNLGMSS